MTARRHQLPTSGTSSLGKAQAQRRWYDEGQEEERRKMGVLRSWVRKPPKQKHFLAFKGSNHTKHQRHTPPHFNFLTNIQVFPVGGWNFPHFLHLLNAARELERRKKPEEGNIRHSDFKSQFGFETFSTNEMRLCGSRCSNNGCT